MFFVSCPRCGAPIEIPPDAVKPGRNDPWNVMSCDECDFSFDFDDADVQTLPDVAPEA